MTGAQKLEAAAIRRLVTSKNPILKVEDWENVSKGYHFKKFIRLLKSKGEIWKEHPTIKGYYGSSLGRVKHICKNGTFFILGQSWERRGEYRLKFSIPGYLVNKPCDSFNYFTNIFITECFCGPKPFPYDGIDSDHKSSCEYDNRAINLRWRTHTENIANKNTRAKVCAGVRRYNEKVKQHIKNGDEPNWKEFCLHWLESGLIPQKEWNRQYTKFFDD